MRTLHILGGLIALIAGAVAMCASKGSAVHRRSGQVFVLAMLVMTSSAIIIATMLRPNTVNVVAGTLTAYLVLTSWLTLRDPSVHERAMAIGLMLIGLLTGCAAAALALSGRTTAIDNVPPQPLYLFASVALLGAWGDARMLWRRGIQGRLRIARHLWRMSLAMWIATTSLFLGQAKFFPEPVRKIALLAIPPLLVLAGLFYWLWRTLRKPRAVKQPSLVT